MRGRAISPRFIITALLLAPFGCERNTATYRCEGGSVVTADIDGSGARVTLPDTTVTLALVRDSAGDRYSNGTYTLWPREKDGAVVQRGDLIIYRHCIGAS